MNKVDFFRFEKSPTKTDDQELRTISSLIQIAKHELLSIKKELDEFRQNGDLENLNIEKELLNFHNKLKRSIRNMIDSDDQKEFTEAVVNEIREIRELESYIDIHNTISDLESNRLFDGETKIVQKAISIINKVSIDLGFSGEKNPLNSLFLIPEGDFLYKKALYSKIRQEQYIEYLKNRIKYTRVSYLDISNLNILVEEMNEKGWILKQVEGIQSSDHHYSDITDRSYGYGYSYTEGTLLIWEKKVLSN